MLLQSKYLLNNMKGRNHMIRTNKAIKVLFILVFIIIFSLKFNTVAKADAPINNYFSVDTSKSITGFAPNIQNDPFVTISNSVQTLPSSDYVDVEYIATKAFQNNMTIQRLVIDNVKGIGSYAFEGCNELEELTIIGDNSMFIDYRAFANCKKLRKIVFDIPDFNTQCYSVDRREYAPILANGNPLTEPILRANSEIFYNVGYDTSSNVNVEIEFGDSVVKVPSYLFKGESNRIKKVILNNVSTIGAAAFEDCQVLEEIIWGNSLSTIEENAFKNCSNLVTANIPTTVEHVASSAFENCTSLIDLTIPKSMKIIEYRAFCNCKNLSTINYNAKDLRDFGADNYIFSNAGANSGNVEVIFGKDVEKIPDYLFNSSAYSTLSTNNITRVDMSQEIKTIGTEAFKNCSKLSYLKFGNNLISIGKSAFENCSSLTTVTLPKKTKTVHESAFEGCSSLRKLCISEQAEFIGHKAFANCKELKEIVMSAIDLANFGEGNDIFYKAGDNHQTLKVVFGNKVKKVPNYMFCSFPGLKTITLSNTITSIGKNAFRDCIKLDKITWGHNVKTIEESAFNGCVVLKEANIPKSVTAIENHAFANCKELTKLTIRKSTNYIGSYVTMNDSKVTLICYKDSTAGEYARMIKKEYGQKYLYFSSIPTNFKIHKTKTPWQSLKLTWKKVSNSKGYAIYRSLKKDKDFKKIKTFKSNDCTSFTNSYLVPNKTYYYKIKALKLNNNYADSEFSVVRSGRPYIKSIKFSSVHQVEGKNIVYLHWGIKTTITGYQIEWKKRNDDWGTHKKITLAKKRSYYIHRKLTSNKTYQYRIRCYLKSGKKTYYGNWSNIRSISIKSNDKKS